MALETLITFAFASFLLSLAPGPDNLFVLMQSALHGTRSGLWITLGLCTGLMVHTALVAAGVAGIFLVNPLAFSILKYVGAAYLIYLAIHAWRAGNLVLQSGTQVGQKAAALYGRGIVMNLSNPKVAIFFLAFLPQFVSPQSKDIPREIMLLGAIFIAVAWLSFSLVALLAGRLSSWVRDRPGVLGHLQRVAAVVFGLLALRLAVSSS